MNSILIVEDNLYLANTIQLVLKELGFESEISTNLKKAYQLLDEKHYQVVLIDRTLPDGDGIELVDFINSEILETKTIIISQKYEVDDRVEGLQSGANAYISKPFSQKELLLKLELVKRMKAKQINSVLSCGKICLHPEEGLLEVDGQTIQVRKKECSLLTCLLQNKNRLVSRDTLIRSVWGFNQAPNQSTIDVYIKRIRDLLKNYDYIDTIRGFGYVIRDQ